MNGVRSRDVTQLK